MSDPMDLIEVRVLQVPVRVYRRSQQHHDELFREFALITLDRTQSDTVPARLLAVIDDLTGKFSGFTAGTSAELAAAVERGDETIDLTFTVPRSAGDASRLLLDLLAEADEYCAQGDLLTLQAPPEAIAFRQWYLEEFVRQADGAEPLPWPAYSPA